MEAAENGLVADGVQLSDRKVTVFEFEFLKAEGIRPHRLQPVQYLRQAHLEPIGTRPPSRSRRVISEYPELI